MENRKIYANDDNSWCSEYSCCLGGEYIHVPTLLAELEGEKMDDAMWPEDWCTGYNEAIERVK